MVPVEESGEEEGGEEGDYEEQQEGNEDGSDVEYSNEGDKLQVEANTLKTANLKNSKGLNIEKDTKSSAKVDEEEQEENEEGLDVEYSNEGDKSQVEANTLKTANSKNSKGLNIEKHTKSSAKVEEEQEENEEGLDVEYSNE